MVVQESNLEEDYFSINLWLEITYDCNYNCGYCYNNYDKSNYSNISISNLKKTLIFFNKTFHIDSITIAGGEPLLFPDLIELILLSKQFSNIVSIVTNGYYINKDVIQNFLDCGLTHVQISMPGHDKFSYSQITKVDDSFEKVLSNLISIQDIEISKSITFVYDHKNVMHISELADILFLLDIPNLVLNEVRYPVGNLNIESPKDIFDYKIKLLEEIIGLNKKFEQYGQTVYISTLIPETIKDLFSSFNNIVLLDSIDIKPRIIIDSKNRIRTCLQSTNKIDFCDFKKQIRRDSMSIINGLIKNDNMCACVNENSLINRI